MKLKTAERIAEQFGDGQCFYDDTGRAIDGVCVMQGARRIGNPSRQAARYEFEDGSALVVARGSWGLGFAAPCACACMARLGHYPDCPHHEGPGN